MGKLIAKAFVLGGLFAALIGPVMPAAAAPMRYDCDTGNGTYSEIIQVQSGPIYALKADIMAMRFGKHRDTPPAAIIEINSRDKNNGVAVQLLATTDKPPALSASLFIKKQGTHQPYGVTTVRLAETLHVSIEAKDGLARVKVAGQSADIPLNLKDGAVVRIGCWTGEFIFENLDISPTN